MSLRSLYQTLEDRSNIEEIENLSDDIEILIEDNINEEEKNRIVVDIINNVNTNIIEESIEEIDNPSIETNLIEQVEESVSTHPLKVINSTLHANNMNITPLNEFLFIEVFFNDYVNVLSLFVNNGEIDPLPSLLPIVLANFDITENFISIEGEEVVYFEEISKEEFDFLNTQNNTYLTT